MWARSVILVNGGMTAVKISALGSVAPKYFISAPSGLTQRSRFSSETNPPCQGFDARYDAGEDARDTDDDRIIVPDANWSDLREIFNKCCSPVEREIHFVTADNDADADDTSDIIDGDWASLHHRGKSAQLLREKLLEAVQQRYDFTLCVRAGRHGRLSPLLVNLPRSQETLRVVLVRPNTQVTSLVHPTRMLLNLLDSKLFCERS
uniref:DUF569 domain-containing protein n=1 Tax=Leersia perrieri TaxID=77586 RepID=A0A0D9X4R4_9ORYZ